MQYYNTSITSSTNRSVYTITLHCTKTKRQRGSTRAQISCNLRMNNWARGSNTIRCRTVVFWEQCWLNLQPTCYQCSSYTLYGRALIQWKSSFLDVLNLNRWLGKWPPRKIYLSWSKNQHLSAVVGGQLGQTTISKNNFFRAKIITRKIWAQKLKNKLEFYLW